VGNNGSIKIRVTTKNSNATPSTLIIKNVNTQLHSLKQQLHHTNTHAHTHTHDSATRNTVGETVTVTATGAEAQDDERSGIEGNAAAVDSSLEREASSVSAIELDGGADMHNGSLYGEWIGLRVEVIDDGRGVSKKDQQKLFMPYRQINPQEAQQGKGSGLGLSIAKRLITLHAGTVGCISIQEPKKQTTFYFQVPVLLITNDQDLLKLATAKKSAETLQAVVASEHGNANENGVDSNLASDNDLLSDGAESDVDRDRDGGNKDSNGAITTSHKAAMLLEDDDMRMKKYNPQRFSEWTTKSTRNLSRSSILPAHESYITLHDAPTPVDNSYINSVSDMSHIQLQECNNTGNDDAVRSMHSRRFKPPLHSHSPPRAHVESPAQKHEHHHQHEDAHRSASASNMNMDTMNNLSTAVSPESVTPNPSASISVSVSAPDLSMQPDNALSVSPQHTVAETAKSKKMEQKRILVVEDSYVLSIDSDCINNCIISTSAYVSTCSKHFE
jgi:hypothetical protein